MMEEENEELKEENEKSKSENSELSEKLIMASAEITRITTIYLKRKTKRTNCNSKYVDL